jgi:uncharacterized protein (TIGR03067 family)
MRHAISLVFLAALAVPALAQDKPGGDDKLVGTWALVKSANPISMNIVAEGEISLVLVGDGKGAMQKKNEPGQKVTWQANPSPTPRTLDLTFVSPGDEKPPTLKCIYRLDGDNLEIAFPWD